MVRTALQKIFPITRLPESEALHLNIVITHRGVPVRCTLQVEINQFFQIRSNNLIGIDENDLLEVHREQNVKEQDFVRPDDTLLFFLSAKPRRPFVRDQFIIEFIGLCQVRDEFLRIKD